MRVLVVEDEPALADALARGLERDGFAVDVAADGIDGLHQARETSYDAIVLDIMLPGLDGLSILRELRGASVWTPILMLTARDADEDITTALDVGADDYLTKPFSLAVLVARLRSLMRRGAPERPALLAARDLSLDPATRRCARVGGAAWGGAAGPAGAGRAVWPSAGDGGVEGAVRYGSGSATPATATASRRVSVGIASGNGWAAASSRRSVSTRTKARLPLPTARN